MTGFFFDIRGLFTAKHSGRYIAMLLRQLAIQEPATFANIFHLSADHRKQLAGGGLQVIKEWRFDSSRKRRRHADLALLQGGEPILLIEIKEDDVNNPTNAAQMDDYLELVQNSNGNTNFAHVSRYVPTHGDQAKLEQSNLTHVRSYRYRDIYEGLADKPFSHMLAAYLEDIGVTKYEQLIS